MQKTKIGNIDLIVKYTVMITFGVNIIWFLLFFALYSYN